ncbi:hypothetical protein M407DRAFT_125277 [Tulasnella calospora MUT 4182]|uniref:DRBM domain-containing protein n=1 Tax=Tulasnella calospora MUT 4182 TaxID=1051891 RepID=A0A0C3Q0U0_9AGAM|nr:hypothetical protein M407DRAFT_207239 [Tulasnella calospora MUT 4182]KIO21622.1 hypothetical protein M407DRAFT_125277 [Tulasnella calospora MUT 4182]
MSRQPAQQYRMLLNNIEQAGHARFEFKFECSGPAQQLQWLAVITVLGVSPPLSASVPVGTTRQAVGSSKSAAKDAACQQMLALFASLGVQPMGGH